MSESATTIPCVPGTRELRALVVGCGSIGMRHLRNLASLGLNSLIACDTNAARLTQLESEIAVSPTFSLTEALARHPQIAFITTPTHLHLQLACALAEAGCDLFIEKPLSHTNEGIDDLIALVETRGLISMVACNMRFHHGPSTIRRLLAERAIGRVVSAWFDSGQYMPGWHPNQDYRQRYSANRAMGGGVILDGIHEIDCAQWLLGDVNSVYCHGGHLSSLEIDVEDCANIVLGMRSGISAHVHLDYLQRPAARACKIIGEQGTIEWDIRTGVRCYEASADQHQTFSPPPDHSVADMYIREIAHFLECVETRKKTICDVREGARVTRIALAAHRSMTTSEVVRL